MSEAPTEPVQGEEELEALPAEEVGSSDVAAAPTELMAAAKRTYHEGFRLDVELHSLRRAIRAFGDNEDWMNAAAVSFYAILSFIPFLLLSLSVLGFVTHGHTQGSLEQFDKLLEPVQGYGFLTPEVTMKLRDLVAARGAIGITGVVILTMMGGAVFRGLEVSVGRIWRGGVIRRGSIRTVVISRLLVGAFAMAAVMLMIVVDWVFSAGLPLLERFAPDLFLSTWAEVERLLPISLLLDRLVIAGAFVLLMKYLTRNRVRWVPALRGGVLFSLLWWLASAGFRVYLANAQLTAVYGAFSTLMIVVLWTFYSSIILLLSAEYAYVWQGLRTENGAKTDSA